MLEKVTSRRTALTVLGFCAATPSLAIGLVHPRRPDLYDFLGGLTFFPALPTRLRHHAAVALDARSACSRLSRPLVLRPVPGIPVLEWWRQPPLKAWPPLAVPPFFSDVVSAGAFFSFGGHCLRVRCLPPSGPTFSACDVLYDVDYAPMGRGLVPSWQAAGKCSPARGLVGYRARVSFPAAYCVWRVVLGRPAAFWASRMWQAAIAHTHQASCTTASRTLVCCALGVCVLLVLCLTAFLSDPRAITFVRMPVCTALPCALPSCHATGTLTSTARLRVYGPRRDLTTPSGNPSPASIGKLTGASAPHTWTSLPRHFPHTTAAPARRSHSGLCESKPRTSRGPTALTPRPHN